MNLPLATVRIQHPIAIPVILDHQIVQVGFKLLACGATRGKSTLQPKIFFFRLFELVASHRLSQYRVLYFATTFIAFAIRS